MKLWEAMLPGDLDQLAEEYNKSINIDSLMLEEDIIASIAHVTMLKECEILQKQEAEDILKGLNSLLEEYRNGCLEIDYSSEDVHTFIENTLNERIGSVAGKMHTARSRNDQVVTDFRIKLAKDVDLLCTHLSNLLKTLAKIASEHKNTIMPGLTHLQQAQVISFAHHLLAWAFAIKRDRERLLDSLKRIRQNPLGACALAGTTFPINRDLSTKLLNFIKPMENSMDAVSTRDFVLELLSNLAILHSNFSRIAEELVLWSSCQFSYIRLSSKFTTGSSIMPQKINPDIAELIRGKTGSIYAALIQSLTMVKALPLAYSKDLQEDKKCVFEAMDNCQKATLLLSNMIDTMTVNKENMLLACQKGYLQATDIADYLAKKGLAFREAHHKAALIVKYAMENKKSLNELSLSEYRSFSSDFSDDIFETIDFQKMLNDRNSYGGPAASSTSKQIELLLNDLD